MEKKHSKKYLRCRRIAISALTAATVFGALSANHVFAGKTTELNNKKLEITEGSYKILKLNGTDKKVKWSIKKGKDIVTLKNAKANSVKIYGEKEGSAKVQAKFKGKAYTCSIKVKAKELQDPSYEQKEPDVTDTPQNTTVPGQDGEKQQGMGKEWEAITGFGSRLLQDLWEEDDNVMVSPVSIFNALAMTANGAKGRTLEQFENLFGMDMEECNNYLKSYNSSLPSGDKYKLSSANSIWIDEKDTFKAEPEFIKKNQDLFGAEIYNSRFSDRTAGEINNWINKNTDGMIKEIIDEVPDNARMYLINALAFDAEWEEVYSENAVVNGKFTKEDGEKEDVPLMYSEEGTYIEDNNTTGFIKYYADSKYAFIGLLPKEGTRMEDYLKSLDAGKLGKLIAGRRKVKVNAALPKFKSEYSEELKETLQKMGLTEAFDSVNADLTGVGSALNDNLYIDDVLHKTFIEVDERGTKAGAATAVMMACGAVIDEEVKTVYLDRPFVYIIADCDSWLPAFYGIVQEIDD
ncbi:MAG: serpin family protein [Lachnospiraceae bacterium]|nr:serpin family protein [Lachnospiraceae bacterium]